MILNILLMMGDQENPWMSFLPLILVVVVFYFFMIRPQTKKAKTMKNFRENINKGDRIVTIGGVHGKIIGVKDSTLIIETEDGGKLKIERSAVSVEFTQGNAESAATTDKIGGGSR